MTNHDGYTNHTIESHRRLKQMTKSPLKQKTKIVIDLGIDEDTGVSPVRYTNSELVCFDICVILIFSISSFICLILFYFNRCIWLWMYN